MPIRINAERNQPSGSTTMTVIVEADQADELTNLNTRNEVMKFARAIGFPARGLGGVPSPYPVDKEGKSDDDLILGRRPIDHWEAAYTVSSGLGV